MSATLAGTLIGLAVLSVFFWVFERFAGRPRAPLLRRGWPIGRVIASPAFHRWHHTKEPEAVDRNFSGLFSFWDVLFGTFYLPTDRVPQDFGITEPMPQGFAGQLWQPFRRTPRP